MTGPAHAADLAAARQARRAQGSSPARQLRGYAWLLQNCPRVDDAVLSRLAARVAWLPRVAGLFELRRALPAADPAVLVGAAERLWPTSPPGAVPASAAQPPAGTTPP